jgi:hypothetical protein
VWVALWVSAPITIIWFVPSIGHCLVERTSG